MRHLGLLRSLQQYRLILDELTNLIEQENWEVLEQKLTSTGKARPDFVD